MKFDAEEIYDIKKGVTSYKCINGKDGSYETGKVYCFIGTDEEDMVCLELDSDGFIIDGQEPCYVETEDIERDFVPVEEKGEQL